MTKHFGAVAKYIAIELQLRHDHGPNPLSNDFQKEIAFLGITTSLSFVREPEDNGVAERLIRTPKENLLWVRDFETIEELRPLVLRQLVGRMTSIQKPNQDQVKSNHNMRVGRMQIYADACCISGIQHSFGASDTPLK